jgi:hypothetical protein
MKVRVKSYHKRLDVQKGFSRIAEIPIYFQLFV